MSESTRRKDASHKSKETDDAARWSRTDTVVLLAVIAVALCVRVVYVIQLRDCPYFDQDTMDAGYHDEWARAIASGSAFEEGPYFRAPLYPWFLGVLYKVTGANYLAVRLIQAMLGSLSCGLVFLIGRRFMPRVAAGVAGLATALYWTIVYFDAELLIPVLAVFLNLLLLWALLCAGERRTVLRCAVAGLLLGVSALARPNVLLFAPLIVLWLAFARPRGKPALLAAGAFSVAGVVPILPVTLHNYRQGDVVLISSQAGVNFFIGNNAAADGMRVHVPGLRPSIREIYHGTTRIAQAEAKRPMRPSEVSSYYTAKALKWMRSQPGAALKLMAKKLMYFWSRSEILNNKHIYFLTDRYTPIVGFLPVGFWLVGPLGLMGLAAAIMTPDRWKLFPLWGFVLAYTVSVVLFFVTARFRVPVIPVLALLAGYGVWTLIHAVRHTRWKTAAVLVVVLAMAVSVVAQPAQDRNAKTLAEVALVDLSKALFKKGRTEEAITLLEEATQINPTYAEALYSLGVAYTKSKQVDLAEKAYRKAIDADRRNVSAHNNLGRLLLDQKRFDEAIPLLRRAVRLDSNHSGARFNLGKALQGAGHLDEAIEAYRSGLLIQPNRADIMAIMAAAYAERGQWDACIEAAEQALDIARKSGNQRLAKRIEQRLLQWREEMANQSPDAEDQ